MSTTIEDRVILLLREKSGERTGDEEKPGVIEGLKSLLGTTRPHPLGGHGFWENLERFTRISAQRWRKAYARRQRPTPDMIEALAKLFPEYAFWLATGVTDAANGHIGPDTAQLFPERMTISCPYSDQYFRAEIELAEKLSREARINVHDDKERMFAVERTRPLAHWWDSPLSDVAYQVAASDEYEDLEDLWKKREAERSERIRNITEPEKRPWVKHQAELKARGARMTPMAGIDPRTKHQDHWDLFYKPQSTKRTRYALSVLNTAPHDLTPEQIGDLVVLPLHDITQYLRDYGLDQSQVFSQEPVIRYSADGITGDEADRLIKYLSSKAKVSRVKP